MSLFINAEVNQKLKESIGKSKDEKFDSFLFHIVTFNKFKVKRSATHRKKRNTFCINGNKPQLSLPFLCVKIQVILKIPCI